MKRKMPRRVLPVMCAATLLGATAAVPAAQAVDPGEFVVRSTAATAPVTDRAGNVWQARSATLGTKNMSSTLAGKDVALTTDDDLYRRNAWGVTGYSTTVPTAGAYRVRLLMAEDFWWQRGQRVFSVTAEGARATDDIDVVAAVGKGAAYDVSFDVTVTDGRLDLGFVKKVDNPMVSAIEVRRLSAPSSSGPFDVRATAADTTITHGGATWQPSDGWVGSARRSTALDGQPIGSTDDDVLYRPQVYGMTGWRQAVPAAGRYTVQLFAVENKYNKVGQRVFDVTAEDRTALAGVDLFKMAGVRTAFAPSFDVDVTDGVLDLGFVNRVDAATVSAIRVTRAGDTTPVVPVPETARSADAGMITSRGTAENATTASPARQFVSRMAARPTPVTDSTGTVWSRWSPGLGSWRRGTGLSTRVVHGTTTPELYQENVWGARAYSVAVSAQPATYRVRLLMADDYYTEPGKRVFGVTAEGRTVAENVDIVAAAGVRTAYDLTFETPVTDGMLDLGFVKKIDQPILSAVEVISTTPVVPPSTAPKRAVPVSPTSFWTQDISAAPVAANSARTVAGIAEDVRTRYGGIAGFNAYKFGVGFHLAGPDDVYTTVDRVCGGTTWTPGVYDGAAHFLDVPVPATATPAAGTDGNLTIYDSRTDKLWSFWQMRRNPDTGRWSACWGGRIDALSKNQGIFPAGYGASASGLPLSPGMVTRDEIRRGRIDHAVAIVVPNARKGLYSWPANRTDGVSSDEDAVQQGQRLRLAADVDLDRYDLSPIGRMIADAAKKYGVIPVDTGGAVAVLAQGGEEEATRVGVNPWDAMIDQRHWDVMRAFPWDRLEALPLDYGRP